MPQGRKPKEVVLVVAATKRQFDYFVREITFAKEVDYRFVYDETHLRGYLPETKVVLVCCGNESPPEFSRVLRLYDFALTLGYTGTCMVFI